MNDAIQNQYRPDFVSPPGETLQEILEEKGMSQAELAIRSGRPRKTINEIIKGKAAIMPETAIQFERVLGVPVTFWNRREQQYREALARQRERQKLEDQTAWLRTLPYRALVKMGWLPDHKEKARQLQEALAFFGVASPEGWNEFWHGRQAAFRHSRTFKSEPGAVAAWLRKGEIEADKIQCAEYDADRFRDALGRARAMTRLTPREFLPRLAMECGPTGVAVVFVREVPGTRLWGATRWLTPTKALIQLSFRYKTDDHFWFTFFHEAGHILLHGKRAAFLEGEDGQSSPKEAEADEFARDWLIPQSSYRSFRRLGAYTCAACSRFAYQLGIAPGIVVGRLQHDQLLSQNRCNELKKRITWSVK